VALLGICRHLSNQDMPYSALLNMVPCGVVVLNTRGRILRANAHAADIFRDNPDVRADKGFLRARSVAHNRALSDALAKLANSEIPQPIGFSIARSTRRPISIVLAKLPPRPAEAAPNGETARIAAFITDPDLNVRPNGQLLRDLFQFTPVETSIAILMMEHRDTSRIAKELHITNNTLREHLKLMFPKVNARNQIELLHVLLCCPARFRFPSATAQDLKDTPSK